MHSPDDGGSAGRGADPELKQVEPYRSPADVSEVDGSAAAKKGLMASPFGWGLLAIGVIAGGAIAYGMLTPSVEEFGATRAGPPKNIKQHVEDVPMIRTGVREPIQEEPIVQQPVVQTDGAAPDGAANVLPVP